MMTVSNGIWFLSDPAKRMLVAFFLLLMLGGAVDAQSTKSSTDGSTPLGLAPGAPAGAYAISGFDNINPYNGHLNFRLPLLKIGGRGELSHTIALLIERKWRVRHDVDSYNQDHYSPDMNWWTGIEPGYGPGVMQGRLSGEGTQQCVSPPYSNFYNFTLTRLTFTASDGTEYELRDANTNGQPAAVSISPPCTGSNASRGTVFKTADGSAATFISDATIYDDSLLINGQPSGGGTFYPTGYLMLRDGTRYRVENGLVTWVRDRNGNKLSFTYDAYSRVISITDSLNRQVTITYNNPHVITYKGFGLNTRTIRVWHDTLQNRLRTGSGYSIQTYQQLFPQLNSASSSTQFNPSIVSSVELPDGRQYQFYYNPYGEIARVILPTGGAFEYDYAAGISGETLFNYITGTTIESLSGVTGGGTEYEIFRRVIERRVYSDGSTLEGKTVYSRPESYSFPAGFANLGYVFIDHQNSSGTLLARNKHYFYGSPRLSMFQGPTAYSAWKDGKEHQTDATDANGTTVLRRAANTWQQRAAVSWWNGSADSAPPNDPRITEAISTLSDTNQVSKQTFSYDQYNNRTDVYEYDYGSGAPPAHPIRRTHTDYLTTNPVNSASYDTNTGIHIRNLPSQQIVYSVNPSNGAETWMAQTKYEYDRYDTSANHAALVNRSGISGLDSSFTTGYTTRGNATQVDRWLNSSGSSLVSSWAQYDIAGNVVKAIDARGYATNFDFSDRFGSPDDDARANAAPAELSGQSSFAFPTKVTNALGHEAYTQFDYHLGKPVNTEDPNGIVSSVAYIDNLDRPTQAIQARYKYGSGATSVKRQTTIVYDDTNRRITTSGDRDTYNDNILTGRAYYDGLGRTWRGATYEGNTGAGNTWSIADTQFDALGRVWRVSNPYRAADPNTASPPSDTWTTTSYDALSRIVSVQTPDTATVTTGYSGNAVTVTDQAGKQRRSLTDALGRLIRVDEPNGCNNCLGTVSSPLQPTSYVYDALDSLRQVTQGSQNRYFMYDSLSRLIRAKNPEQAANGSIALSDPITGNSQWSMAYSYDAVGNMLTRVDARNVTTTYAYDNLNRNTSVSYNDGITPGLNRYYDGATNGIGRFYYSVTYNTHPVTSGLAYHRTFITEYDAVGRPKRYVPGFYPGSGNWIDYQILRSYDLAGNVTQQTYPSNRTIANGYDAAGRLNSFTGTLGDGNSRNYATGITYTPAGQMSRETFGMQANTLYHNLHYNNRLQLVDIRVGDSSTDEWNWSRGALISYYGTAARDAWDPFKNSPDNNGNVLRQLHYVPLSGGGYVLPQLDDYTYDALNRITSVTEAQLNSSGGWTFNLFTQNFGYDRWGNRTVNCSPCQPGVTGDVFTIDTATNRITAKNGVGMTYDSAGNQTYDATGNRWFDGENRMHKATQGGTTSHYVYDADGKRVRRIIGPTETWMIYGIDGELVGEYAAAASATSPQKEYGYRSGQMLVIADTSPLKITWLVTDHLGTPRMNIRGSGTDGGSLASVTRHDYLPFGEDLIAGIRLNGSVGQYGYEPPPDGVRQKFGSKERDTETGLDYFFARYYSNVQGRFTGVDPENAGAILDDPQSWNGYTYTLNNPVVLTDPDGRRVAVCSPDGKECYYHDDKDFFNAKKVGKEGGFTFTRNDGFLASGAIYDANGTLVAIYHQVDVDDRAGQLTYEMQKALNDPEVIKRAATNIIVGVMISGSGPSSRKSSSSGASNSGLTLGEMIGTLRETAKKKGNFGMGKATRAESQVMGEAWVGPGYRVASDGKTLISADGLRQYRPPSNKPRLGKEQANFEWRTTPSGPWTGNGHLDVQ